MTNHRSPTERTANVWFGHSSWVRSLISGSATSAASAKPIPQLDSKVAAIHNCLQPARRQREGRIAAARCGAKKAPRKAHVPGGQRTLKPFRERLDAITLACGRTHMQIALGGRKRLPRVGECIVADGWRPCQRQPLRGLTFPSRGADPSTWFVGLRSESSSARSCAESPSRFASQCSDRPRRLAPRAPHSFPRRGAAKYVERPNRSRLIFTRCKNLIAMCCHFHREQTNSREIRSEIAITTQHRCVHSSAMGFRQSLQLAQTTPAMMATGKF